LVKDPDYEGEAEKRNWSKVPFVATKKRRQFNTNIWRSFQRLLKRHDDRGYSKTRITNCGVSHIRVAVRAYAHVQLRFDRRYSDAEAGAAPTRHLPAATRPRRAVLAHGRADYTRGTDAQQPGKVMGFDMNKKANVEPEQNGARPVWEA
jgi:hypothetical protein